MRKTEKTDTPGASQHLQMPRMIIVLYDMDLNIYMWVLVGLCKYFGFLL